MVQPGGGLRLAAEPVDEARIPRELRQERLDGHCPVQPPVVPAPHLGHPAATEWFLDLVPIPEDPLQCALSILPWP
jgi:hypothetical protein